MATQNITGNKPVKRIEVGTVLYTTIMTYARSNEFYRVTRVSDKSVWVEKLKNKVVSDDGFGQNGKEVADLAAEAAPIKQSFRKHLYDASYMKVMEEYIKIDSSHAYFWDGNPLSFYTD